MDVKHNELHASNDAEQKYIKNLAPVIIFAYNRRDHLEQTIETLKKNKYADSTILYVYSDGYRDKPGDKEKIEDVREYLHSINSGFKEINVIERDKNWGLGRNIIDGVTRIINQYGKIIVLEDDILTSVYFLQYMNDALFLYENDESVMEIGGFVPHMSKSFQPENSYFLPWATSWGWATWSRSWKFFDRNPEKIVSSITDEELYRININGAEAGQWNQVVRNLNGSIFTWAIFFSVAIIKNNGLVLYSDKSMCRNIGFDGSGTNCGDVNVDYVDEIAQYPVTLFPASLEVDKAAEKAYVDSIRKRNHARKIEIYKSMPKRIITKILSRFKTHREG